MIEAAGAELCYLPPYSRDFNALGLDPRVENAFARHKALLRTAAGPSVDCLWVAIARIVDLFTPTECRACFAHAGYDAA